MLVDPAIAMLRSAPAPQHRTEAALAAWRSLPEVEAARGELARYDAGEPLEALPALARLLAGHGAASALASGFITALCDALRAEPLAHLPLGHATSPGFARLRLAASGRAALTLAAYAKRPCEQPVSALFEDGVAHEIIIAGAGLALVHRREQGRLATREARLAPGTCLHRKGPEDARQIVAVTRPLLVLQLTREAAQPAPSQEIALADGRLIKTISGCKHTSQQIMALAVLGALEHEAAVPAMAALARDRSKAADLRWEALRHCLALDASEGLAVLATFACDAGDPLQASAGALHRQLAAAHPGLDALLPEPA